METSFPHHLAELLTSRLCHDLISPISAINTGLELFQETSPGQHTESDEILGLILNSAHTASARISFYRVAFGSGGGKTSVGMIKDLIEKYFLRSKLKIHWKDSFKKDQLLDMWGRILLNAVLWMSECAPRGGQLEITMPREDSPVLSLRLKADSIILHQGTVEALEGKSQLQDITPRTVPCYFLFCIVKGDNGNLKVTKTSSPSELVLEVTMNQV